MQGIFDLPLPRFHHISPTPHFYAYGEPGESETAFAARCADALEQKILELGPDQVAAFIGEPVMGAGGLMIPPDGYWPRIEEICRKYDILLWADEVICGFGRTGEWFGCQTYGFTPDVMTMAKGLSSGYQPISATVVNHRMAQAFIDADSEMAHGYTYSGHPVAAAVAIRNIELIEELDLIGARGRQTANRFAEALATFEDHPLVGETRNVGLLGALELVKDKAKKERFSPAGAAGLVCRRHCFDAGVVMRAIGDAMVLCPPLIISDDEIDEMFAPRTNCARPDV